MSAWEIDPGFDMEASRHEIVERIDAHDDDEMALEPAEQTFLGNGILAAFNPADDDIAFGAILYDAVVNAAVFIRSLRCQCEPGDDEPPCDRCAVMGRWHDEPLER